MTQQSDILLATETGVKRAEWGVVISLIMSAGTLLFSAGVVYGSVTDQGRRLQTVENKLEMQSMAITRIDANVAFLAERAREDRARR